MASRSQLTNNLPFGKGTKEAIFGKTEMPDVEIHVNCPPFMSDYASIIIKSDNKITCYKYDGYPDMEKLAKKFDNIFGPADSTVPNLEPQDLSYKKLIHLFSKEA